MSAMMGALLKACLARLGGGLLWRGSSVKTADYEIHAPTTAGVVAIMDALRDMPPNRPLPRARKSDSLSHTVQAEEPMTVKG